MDIFEYFRDSHHLRPETEMPQQNYFKVNQYKYVTLSGWHIFNHLKTVLTIVFLSSVVLCGDGQGTSVSV